MAGIGFELKKILKDETLNQVVRAYSFAGIISAGPWVISVLSLTIIYLIITKLDPSSTTLYVQFQTCVTYLIGISLIISGSLQYAFTRYIADRLFEKKTASVLPNTLGLIVFCTLVTIPLSIIYTAYFLAGTTFFFRLINAALLIVLSNLWLISNLLSGLKAYQGILYSFGLSAAITVFSCTYGKAAGLEGMMLGFFIGQSLLLLFLLSIIVRYYFTKQLLSFDFLSKKKMYRELMFTGILYNAGLWIDKFLFWGNADTSQAIIGHLRASLLYDLPMYLSFYLLIPGMAVFLFRMETDFVTYYDAYYNAIRHGGSLSQIKAMHAQMVESVREGLIDIVKIQAYFTFLGFIFSENILSFFNFPPIHSHLLQINMLSIDCLVIFIALMNVNFYIDERHKTFYLSLLFFISNAILSYMSILAGVYYYGFGLLLSLIITNMVALFLLNRNFAQLTFTTFMR